MTDSLVLDLPGKQPLTKALALRLVAETTAVLAEQGADVYRNIEIAEFLKLYAETMSAQARATLQLRAEEGQAIDQSTESGKLAYIAGSPIFDHSADPEIIEHERILADNLAQQAEAVKALKAEQARLEGVIKARKDYLAATEGSPVTGYSKGQIRFTLNKGE
jgi:hypothetical protein